MVISGAPALDSYSGTVVALATTSNTVGFGGIFTANASGVLTMANATTSATMPVLGIAVETGSGSTNVLLNGFISKTGWTWTKGAVYADTTNGVMTQTAPSTSANIVQPIGFAFTATKIYFNPDLTVIEVA